MTSHPRPAARVLLTILAASAFLGGCVGPRVMPYANEVKTRYLGEPATRALKELGPPRWESPVADLRSYVWQTGQAGAGALGGYCRLQLVADPRGTVVDYAIDGTPLGCSRLLSRS
jgi:hypothetical protein